MLRYILRRLATAIPTLFAVITLSFFMMRIAPGGPFDQERALDPVIRANMEAAYHLDLPLWHQYLMYLGNLVQGDLGPSFTMPEFTVAELFKSGLPVSVQLGGWALLTALILGGILGIMAALRQNGWVDLAVVSIATAGSTIPTFVVAPVFQLVFGLSLMWLPVGGWQDGAVQNMIGPVVCLMLPQLAVVARLMRGSMIEALPAAAALLTGSVVVETIFSVPGVGRYFVDAALNRDYTVVMGAVVVVAIFTILFNLIVDVLYAVIDPRVRYA